MMGNVSEYRKKTIDSWWERRAKQLIRGVGSMKQRMKRRAKQLIRGGRGVLNN